MAGWGRKAENKAKAQYSTDITPSKLLAELQHSAWLGKTFPGGWVGGWVAGVVGGWYHFVAPSCKLKLARFSA